MKTVKEAEPLGTILSWIFTFSTKLKKMKQPSVARKYRVYWIRFRGCVIFNLGYYAMCLIVH
jgi:hypothetical protein